MRTLAAALLAVIAGTAGAQTYPNKPIRIIVPYAAGGTSDILARQIGPKLTDAWGQPVIVDNRPGANGNVGAEFVAKSAPDGYTLLLTDLGGLVISASVYPKLPFNPAKDFSPVVMVSYSPHVLAVNPDVQVKDVKELVAMAKAHPGKLNFAISGIGGAPHLAGIGAASHLCGMLFMSAIQTDFQTIPYKGTGPAMNDLIGGQVDFMCDQTTNTTSHIKSGKVKAYAVTSAKRVPSLPDLPTLNEMGVKGAEVSIWHALYAPKGTPKPALDKLVSSMQEALKDETVRKRFADLGADTYPADKQTPQALQQHLKSEIDKWGPLIKKAGVYAD